MKIKSSSLTVDNLATQRCGTLYDRVGIALLVAGERHRRCLKPKSRRWSRHADGAVSQPTPSTLSLAANDPCICPKSSFRWVQLSDTDNFSLKSGSIPDGQARKAMVGERGTCCICRRLFYPSLLCMYSDGGCLSRLVDYWD
jgi:hypothetical protein